MSSTGNPQNEMQDYIEKALNAAFAAMKAAGKSTEGVDWQQIAQNAQKQWAAGGAGPMGKRQKEVVSMHARAVARNKRLAASLRQGSIGMPNIAAVMTGQIGGPVGQLGKMQKAISSPFQQMYNFQKEQEDFEKEKDKMDPDERREREAELKEQESQQNPIAKLLGKHVKRMGKFMESGTGQVLGGGIMAMGSIATMIIKKAIEASPMMQAMLKLMNTAMTLFLRPIGDFMGGVMKPISMFFLREVALPFLKAGKGFISMGEQVGKQLLGVLLKPAETIGNAIMLALSDIDLPEAFGGGKLGALAGAGSLMELSKTFDPMKEWASDQKLNTLARQISPFIAKAVGKEVITADELRVLVKEFYGVNNIGQMNKPAYGTAPGQGSAHGLGVYGVEGRELLDLFEQILYEQEQNTYFNISGMMNTTSIGTDTSRFDDIVPQDLSELMRNLGLASKGLAVEFSSVAEALKFIQAAANDTAIELPEWYDNMGKWLDEGSITLEEFTTSLNYWIENIFVPQTEEIGHDMGDAADHIATAEVSAELIQGSFLEMNGYSVKAAESTFGIQSAFAYGLSDANKSEGFLNSIMEVFKRMADVAQQGLRYWTQKYEGGRYNNQYNGYNLSQITSINGVSVGVSGGGGGNRPSPNSSPSSTPSSSPSSTPSSSPSSTTSTKKTASKRPKRRADGGWITEPIWGVGASGTEYTFGEEGAEFITPKDEMGDGGIFANINIRIDRVTSDVDLEKIKPIVERALLEIHSRRGMI